MAIFQPAPSGSVIPWDFGVTEALGWNKPNQSVINNGALFYSPNSQAASTGFTPTATTQYSSPIGPTRPTVLGTSTSGGGQAPQQQQQQGPSGPSQAEQQAINNVYNPTMDYLNSLEQQYQLGGQVYQGQENALKANYTDLGTALANRGTEQNAVVDTQQGQVDQTAQNALTQARQLYNELSQGQLARYGAGSSAGPAASEILGRATQQQFGQVANTQQQGTQALGLEHVKIKNFLAEKQAQFATEQQNAIQQLQQDFRDRLNQIQGQKAQTESAKAAANLQALQDYRNQAMQIQSAAQLAQVQLNTWAQAKTQGLGQIAGFSANNTIGPNTSNALQQAGTNFANKRAGLGGQPAAVNTQIPQMGAIQASPNQYGQPQKLDQFGNPIG